MASVGLYLEWCAIRDVWFGHNFALADFDEALEMARKSKCAEASWLIEIVGTTAPSCSKDAVALFVGAAARQKTVADRARALCFAALSSFPTDMILLKQSSDLGDAYAQAWMSIKTLDRTQKVKFASESAEQNERGFHRLLLRFFFFFFFVLIFLKTACTCLGLS